MDCLMANRCEKTVSMACIIMTLNKFNFLSQNFSLKARNLILHSWIIYVEFE